MKSKAEKKIYNKIWRQANRPRLLEYGKTYYQSHLEEFRNRKKIYLETHRKEINAKAKIYREAHRKERKVRLRAYYLAHRPKQIIDLYGITQIEFDELLNNQGGVCAICKQSNWHNRKPQIDHDHITKKVRGILCFKCNSAVGLIEDNPKIAQSMIDYLKKNNPEINSQSIITRREEMRSRGIM